MKASTNETSYSLDIMPISFDHINQLVNASIFSKQNFSIVNFIFFANAINSCLLNQIILLESNLTAIDFLSIGKHKTKQKILLEVHCQVL